MCKLLCRYYQRQGKTLKVPWGFPDGSVVKNLPTNAGDAGFIPGSWRSPREGNGNPLWYSCLENPTDRGAWWATVHGATKSQTRLSGWAQTVKCGRLPGFAAKNSGTFPYIPRCVTGLLQSLMLPSFLSFSLPPFHKYLNILCPKY